MSGGKTGAQITGQTIDSNDNIEKEKRKLNKVWNEEMKEEAEKKSNEKR